MEKMLEEMNKDILSLRKDLNETTIKLINALTYIIELQKEVEVIKSKSQSIRPDMEVYTNGN